MARTNSRAAGDTRDDAIALLKKDHRTVEALFDRFEDAEDEECSAIAERVCQLLTVHAQIEEEILYPAAKQTLEEDEDEAGLVYEAEVEHATAKDLIAKIEGMTEPTEEFKATFKVLSEYIKHHVKEEEGEMFPTLKKTELDLKQIGSQLAQRKMELMEQMGIPQESDEALPPRARGGAARAKGRGRSSSRSHSRAARH